ncbi:hypothetical protein AALO_G00097970 [Alosa alosa]|uniref:Uncharacterized protein n=1 Tax=Alosa alosa TaxID=278164 RepID=A0AAV6GY77_9TELE|nr:hypothetical protein AALO_G00097970 [Alosa alosa]
MGFATFLWGLLWITLLCPVASWWPTSPWIDPQRLVVKYGDGATASCSSTDPGAVIRWNATVGAKEEKTMKLEGGQCD